MKKAATLVAAGLAMLTVGISCGPKRLDLDDLDKKEWVVLAVGVNNAGKCALREKQTSDIRTEAKSEVNWIVVGYCPAVDDKPQTISIDRKFMKHGGTLEFDPFKNEGSVLSISIPTSQEGPWGRLIGRIKDTVSENEKGRYKYKIRINESVAEWRSPADDGDFYLCPVWPCED